MLARALEAYESGDYAAALLAVEYVCRRHPTKNIPAILRAKLLQACRPELTAKAWYRAWCCDPENPALQDVMLRAWLSSGAAASVADLGPAFLPARCRSGQHGALIALLRQAGITHVGACWKAGDAIEGMLFTPPPAPGTPHRLRLVVADESTRFEVEVPADGARFRFAIPRPQGTWSLAFKKEETAAPQLLHGSPLVFPPAKAETATPTVPPVTAATPTPTATVPPAKAETATPATVGWVRVHRAHADHADHDKHRDHATHETRPPVAIIIPVYRDQALVEACIESVLTSQPQNKTRTTLIVIDDASPEPTLSAWLDKLAADGRITLLRNPNNLGFIETTNRGLRQHPTHDALLLNADTLVQGDWIDRLCAALYSAPDIASVTPWSNNGEISSFPKIATVTPSPLAAQLAQLDNTAAALRQSGATADVEVPACCGFTMLMRASVIERIGILDGVGLTRGYGEEVDWCLRARAAGYRHLAATGVFVAHTGTVSFRFEKTLRVRQNRSVLAARYPAYYGEYHNFIQDDPLSSARSTLRSALEQAGSDWLAAAINLIDGKTEFARALPGALASSCTRIAVWHHRISSKGAAKVLELARLIASRDPAAPALRLLVIGEASEALWHTGVVDVMPSAILQDSTLLTDAALVGLGACKALLTDSAAAAPIGIACTATDAGFEPAAWLADWLAQQGQPTGAAKRKAQTSPRSSPKKTATA